MNATTIECLLCKYELENEDGSIPAPLCAVCKQDNYLLKQEGQWVVFSNEGQQLTGDKVGVVCLHKFRRQKGWGLVTKGRPPIPPTTKAG